MNAQFVSKVVTNMAHLYESSGSQPVFAVRVAGGLGGQIFDQFHQSYEDFGRPFPMASISYDTDSSTRPKTDIHVQLRLSAKQLRTIDANAEKIHPILRRVVDRLKKAKAFSTQGITKGSRSVRMITQLVMIANLNVIVEQERKLFDLICTRYQVPEILPVYISSTGGGCGGSVVCQLLSLYGDDSFRDDVFLTADEDLQQPAICIFAEPFAYARKVSRNQRTRILSNSFAVRLETDEIANAYDSIQYCFHIGYSNRSSVSLTNDRVTSQVIGKSAFDLLLNYPTLKALLVNHSDFQAHIPYGGNDTLGSSYPELVEKHHLINNGQQ